MVDLQNKTGAVVIGRNEGERLKRCLQSLVGRVASLVYVDSGSNDGSCDYARSSGVEVLSLDMSMPFTAARARNAGFEHLLSLSADLEYVQFVDGDSELIEGWLSSGVEAMAGSEKLGAVCGRTIERYRASSVYNRLCDMEWDIPSGETGSCGGNTMIRVEAFRSVSGFNERLICGEEPELCLRLRAKGWRIERLDTGMAMHDAAMTRFSQWWKRCVRSGWYHAEGMAMHGRGSERYCVRQSLNIWFYGLIVPLAVLILVASGYGLGLLMLLVYPVHVYKVYRMRLRHGDRSGDALLYAMFCTLAKWPETVGQVRYWFYRLSGRVARLIEYKQASREGTVKDEQSSEVSKQCAVGYLVNQYPMVSHSFIRREIRGLTDHGVVVKRYSIRSTRGRVHDESDKEEVLRTRAVLSAGALRLLKAFIFRFRRPFRLFTAVMAAIRLAIDANWRLPHHVVYFLESCCLADWLEADGVCHLHAHFGTNSTSVALLCHRLTGIPYSFTVHGPEEFDKPERISLPRKIRAASFVVAISSFGRSQLYRWCRHDQWPKIHIVHCGLDETYLSVEHECVPDVTRFVCVGRLCEQKGQLLLIEALHRMVRGGVSVELVLVGDGEMRGEIELLIRRYALSDHVRITGWADSDRVREEILSSRAMVLPSFAEGLPVVIMESLALCRPVITTQIAGIPELVHPDCGLLIPAGSVDSLVESMTRFLAMPVTELTAMGEAGAMRVSQAHNVRHEAEKLAVLFRQSMEKS